MSFTFENLFNELETRMHPGLISANAFASIKTVGRLLANGITYGLGFETRPAEALAEVDLILRPMAPQGLDIIAGQAAGSQFPDTLAEDPHWGTLQALCRNWANPGSVLRETVACLWIEIDAEHCREPAPKPSLVFVQLHRSRYHPELCLSVAQELHASLKGYPLSSTIIRSLGHCLERMPKKGLVTLLGLALARPSEALRLVVGELEPDEIPEYVASLGWKGRINELESLIFSLAGYADRHSSELVSHPVHWSGLVTSVPSNTWRAAS